MVLELDPEEVEDVLRVTAMALDFPSLPPEPWSSSKRRPITGVCSHTATGITAVMMQNSLRLSTGSTDGIEITAHLGDIEGEVQSFSGQSLGRTVPHPADLKVGEVALRVAVHWMDQAGRARNHQLQDVQRILPVHSLWNRQ